MAASLGRRSLEGAIIAGGFSTWLASCGIHVHIALHGHGRFSHLCLTCDLIRGNHPVASASDRVVMRVAGCSFRADPKGAFPFRRHDTRTGLLQAFYKETPQLELFPIRPTRRHDKSVTMIRKKRGTRFLAFFQGFSLPMLLFASFAIATAFGGYEVRVVIDDTCDNKEAFNFILYVSDRRKLEKSSAIRTLRCLNVLSTERYFLLVFFAVTRRFCDFVSLIALIRS